MDPVSLTLLSNTDPSTRCPATSSNVSDDKKKTETTPEQRIAYLRDAIHKPFPNLASVIRDLDALKDEVQSEHSLSQCHIHQLTHHIEEIRTSIHKESRDLLHIQQKWLSAGFDESLLSSDPEAVQFAVDSSLIYTVAMFKDAGSVLENNDIDIRNVDGKAFFKVEGQWVSYQEVVSKKIVYEESLGRFPGWNFVHPMGFIRKDSENYDTPYPIAKLSKEAHDHVRAEAAKMHDRPESPWILQAMTSSLGALKKTWITKNLVDRYPEHASFRLIDKDGNLYSMGTKLRPHEATDIFSFRCGSLLRTTDCKVATPDYEESKKFAERRVTSIPVTEDQFNKVIAFAQESNQGEGVRFNAARQNCTKFVQEVLRRADITVDTCVTFPSYIRSILPDLKDIPVIGKPLDWLVSKICWIATTVFRAIGELIPEPIKRGFHKIGIAIMEAAKKVAAVMWNWIAILMGGLNTNRTPKNREDTINNESRLTFFSRLVKSSRLLDPHLLDLYASHKLKEWQLLQPSTHVFHHCPHGFLVDPQVAD